MRRKSPITIQQWVDSLPIPEEKATDIEPDKAETVVRTSDSPPSTSSSSSTRMNSREELIKSSDSVSCPLNPPPCHFYYQNDILCTSPRSRDIRGVLSRDASFQSDDASSHCSSVESVLESRRPDPEAVLIGLGFGPSRAQEETSRIPKRFLQPSKVAGVDIERFLQEQRDIEAADAYYWPQMHSSLNLSKDKYLPPRDSSSYGPS